ncbi:hypothetical protein B0H12DRAFT_1093664 [Mycena haematopus]|nr:hypothetical protein B0H12DRAFT_1093664 [Mycena haematopus]
MPTISQEQYGTIKETIDHYIRTINVQEQNQALRAQTVQEFEQYLAKFHSADGAFKNWFFGRYNARLANATSEAMRIAWAKYQAQSKRLREEAQARAQAQAQAEAEAEAREHRRRPPVSQPISISGSVRPPHSAASHSDTASTRSSSSGIFSFESGSDTRGHSAVQPAPVNVPGNNLYNAMPMPPYQASQAPAPSPADSSSGDSHWRRQYVSHRQPPASGPSNAHGQQPGSYGTGYPSTSTSRPSGQQPGYQTQYGPVSYDPNYASRGHASTSTSPYNTSPSGQQPASYYPPSQYGPGSYYPGPNQPQ